LTIKQFNKRFPGAKPKRPSPSAPRPIWRNIVHFQLKYPEWKVCLGFVESGVGPVPFAWGELENKILEISNIPENVFLRISVGYFGPQDVADLFKKYGSSKRDFYRKNKVGGVRRYSKPECRARMDKFRTYGPWKE
jgi:hypothetical protein